MVGELTEIYDIAVLLEGIALSGAIVPKEYLEIHGRLFGNVLCEKS